VIVRRRFLALLAAIAFLFLASIAIIDRVTRPAAGGPAPRNAEPPAPVARPAEAPAPPAPQGAPRTPATAPRPEPVVARAVQSERRAEGATVPAPVPGAARVDVSFKLDPRLTKGLHTGDRWVSPRTYRRTGDLKSVTVDARARVVGGGTKQAHATTAWSASEPDMVEISPEEGEQVRITVWRPGESRVTVNAGSASGTLTVRAAEVQGALRVDIVR
jgi:hypothetical protein